MKSSKLLVGKKGWKMGLLQESVYCVSDGCCEKSGQGPCAYCKDRGRKCIIQAVKAGTEDLMCCSRLRIVVELMKMIKTYC